MSEQICGKSGKNHLETPGKSGRFFLKYVEKVAKYDVFGREKLAFLQEVSHEKKRCR